MLVPRPAGRRPCPSIKTLGVDQRGARRWRAPIHRGGGVRNGVQHASKALRAPIHPSLVAHLLLPTTTGVWAVGQSPVDSRPCTHPPRRTRGRSHLWHAHHHPRFVWTRGRFVFSRSVALSTGAPQLRQSGAGWAGGQAGKARRRGVTDTHTVNVDWISLAGTGTSLA